MHSPAQVVTIFLCSSVVENTGWEMRFPVASYNTLFLKTLVSELPACFLHLRITDLAEWVSALPSWNYQVIGEADCTQQFDKVPPTPIIDSLKEAGTWLRKKKQRRAQETVWSIHKHNPAHDRAGMGQHTQFEYITQQQLEALVEFSLTKDIYAQAAGQLWCRSASIPMGGPFSAQGADLHSVWQAKKKCQRLSQIGNTSIFRPLWDTPRGNTVSLHNLEITSSRPPRDPPANLKWPTFARP